MAPRSAAPARAAAFRVLLRESGSTGPFDLQAAAAVELAGLDMRDRALAYELVMGTIKRRNSLDRVIAAYARAAAGRLDNEVRESLRLGAFQLLYLDRVPAHAAVSDAVELVKHGGSRGASFVNAVLRKVAAEGPAELERLCAGDSLAALALRHSHPEWLVALWDDELGREGAEALMAADNLPAERCVRVNRLRTTPAGARAALERDAVAATPPAAVPVEWRTATPDALVLAGAPLETSAAFRDGLVTPQSRGSQLAAAIAAAPAAGVEAGDGSPAAEAKQGAGTPAAGAQEGVASAAERMAADLCAAPGGKTSQLAALLEGWRVVAVDDEPGRVDALRGNLTRLGATDVEVLERDVLAMGADERERGRYRVVLLDAPCCGLGTLASRPELRWRRRAGDVARLAALQRRLLAAAAPLVAPGGTLTYSVCTLTRAETLDVVARFLAAPRPDEGEPVAATGAVWELDDLGAEHPALRHPDNGACVQTLPSRDATTGFFVARLRRVT